MRHPNCLHSESEICTFCTKTVRPTFERTADASLNEARSTYAQRGGEYGDSWALENMQTAFLDSTLAAMGLTNVPAEMKRLLLLASLVDVKDSRLVGPWKKDSVLDGIAYRAAYMTLRDEYEKKNPAP